MWHACSTSWTAVGREALSCRGGGRGRHTDGGGDWRNNGCWSSGPTRRTFVWRAAGTIALTVAQGGKAQVVALSYGERGESGELWKQPGQTVENVKRIRHAEAEQAAAAIGATFRCLDLGDYPLVVDASSPGRAGGPVPRSGNRPSF